MKKLFGLISAIGFLSILYSCSPIAEDERLIYVEPPVVSRAVLVEDFTGQGCVNCPFATLKIEELQQQYGTDNVIAVAIHCGSQNGFAGNARNIGLMNDESKAYGQYWNVDATGQPIGMINRNGGLKDRNAWSTAVYDEIQKQASVIIDLDAQYDEAALCAAIDVKVSALQDVSGKLQLWLLQDSIVAMQHLPKELWTAATVQEYDLQYMHNHVFRASVNGQWGDPISLDNGKTHEAQYTVSLDNEKRPQFSPEYVPQHCSIVAFVYNDSGVLQVAKQHLRIKQKQGIR